MLSEVSFVIWEDEFGGRLARRRTDASPHSYRIGPAGTSQMLIADEDKEVRINRITQIRIREIEIPAKSIVLPSFWIRHPLGFVAGAVEVGMPKNIEEHRKINEIIFHPITDGSIQKNDLLGVVNILYAHPEYELSKEAIAEMLQNRRWFG